MMYASAVDVMGIVIWGAQRKQRRGEATGRKTGSSSTEESNKPLEIRQRGSSYPGYSAWMVVQRGRRQMLRIQKGNLGNSLDRSKIGSDGETNSDHQQKDPTRSAERITLNQINKVFKTGDEAASRK